MSERNLRPLDPVTETRYELVDAPQIDRNIYRFMPLIPSDEPSDESRSTMAVWYTGFRLKGASEKHLRHLVERMSEKTGISIESIVRLSDLFIEQDKTEGFDFFEYRDRRKKESEAQETQAIV